jgi:uncharacterized damage-inducible protein DinB
MTAKDTIRGTIELAHSITQAYLSDLSDADLLVRPAAGANHVAWQLGHLIGSEHHMMSSIGVTMPEVPAGFIEAHDKEAAKSDDPQRFSGKDEYLALMRKMHDATLEALQATPDADLDKPGPEAMRDYAPTVGAVFNMIGAHELMHVGQFAAVRRKLGKPVLI